MKGFVMYSVWVKVYIFSKIKGVFNYDVMILIRQTRFLYGDNLNAGRSQKLTFIWNSM